MPGTPQPDSTGGHHLDGQNAAGQNPPGQNTPGQGGSGQGGSDQGAGARQSSARPVRCPSCRREHSYEPSVFPCPCGASLKVPLLRGGIPVQVRFRSWEDSWLSMRCPSCGRSEEWPQPEFTCGCGATVRLPVDTARRPIPVSPPTRSGPAPRPATGRPQVQPPMQPAVQPPARPRPAPTRPPFLPHPVRTSDDAVLAAARYLEWLGFGELEVSDSQDREGVCLLGTRVVAQVDTWTEPADLRAVECLWLNTLHADELQPIMFTLAGYNQESRNRADQLLVALFELDLAGVPQPVNSTARELLRTGGSS
ncbi:hypothetical protein ABIA33_004552 [Streptacidiphilus sp. MAP12-16]|uniref:hypothetical protein n=1 Tax=Streptacidiphilus sp. MAP12-16 TaxID=3156300 RepID=UPI00351560B2